MCLFDTNRITYLASYRRLNKLFNFYPSLKASNLNYCKHYSLHFLDILMKEANKSMKHKGPFRLKIPLRNLILSSLTPHNSV